jgi:hypothetical protein
MNNQENSAKFVFIAMIGIGLAVLILLLTV